MSQKKGLWKNFTVVVLLLAALSCSFVLLVQGRGKVKVKNLVINIEDSSTLGFVRRDSINAWLTHWTINPIGVPIKNLDLNGIETKVAEKFYVRHVEATSSMTGEVTLSLKQNNPQIRVLTENGYNFYADTLGNVLPPIKGYFHNVPIVSGMIFFNFPNTFFGNLLQKNNIQDAQYLKKLINFVGCIEADNFFKQQITQIYILPDRQIELLTPTQGQVICFGTVDNVEEKLQKTKDFFAQAPPMISRGDECRIVVKYKDQIIVKPSPQNTDQLNNDGQ